MTLRVLSWNLYHGRADPPAGRPLFDEFAAMLAGWPWDVALLQEVPPWWPPQLARATGADERHVLTSRNFLLPCAVGWPSAGPTPSAPTAAAPTRSSCAARRSRHTPRPACAAGPSRAGLTGEARDRRMVVNIHATVPKEDPEQRDVGLALRLALRLVR